MLSRANEEIPFASYWRLSVFVIYVLQCRVLDVYFMSDQTHS